MQVKINGINIEANTSEIRQILNLETLPGKSKTKHKQPVTIESIYNLLVENPKGLNYKEIAEQLNCDLKMISGLISYMVSVGKAERLTTKRDGCIIYRCLDDDVPNQFYPIKRIKRRRKKFKHKAWKPDEDETLIELKKFGVSDTEIAKKLGRTRSSVHMRYMRVIGKIPSSIQGV